MSKSFPPAICKFVSLMLCFALSSKIQFKTCYREEFEQFKIHHMDTICPEIATFKEFAMAVLQTVAKRYLSSHDHFY